MDTIKVEVKLELAKRGIGHSKGLYRALRVSKFVLEQNVADFTAKLYLTPSQVGSDYKFVIPKEDYARLIASEVVSFPEHAAEAVLYRDRFIVSTPTRYDGKLAGTTVFILGDELGSELRMALTVFGDPE